MLLLKTMSSKKDEILSIDHDDDNLNYDAFSLYLDDDTKRKKNKVIFEINNDGKQLLDEIDRKNKKRELNKIKLIPYILKHSNKMYNIDELKRYDLTDVQCIYDEIKTNRKSQIIKFFKFLFNT